MSPAEVRAALEGGAIPLDMRVPRRFAREHLPGAVNIQFNRADLADRAEMLLPRDRSYVVHAEPEPIARMAVGLLADAGFRVEGHLEGGLAAWTAEGGAVETLPVMDVDALEERLDALQVLDVREGFEYRHGHIPGALHIPWTESWERADEAGSAPRPLAVVCGDEVRSAAAASVLQRAGLAPTLVVGGMTDWLERGYPTEKGAGRAT